MGFLVKIDSYKFCHCIYWLKCELSYIVVSSDRSHVNWLPWFKILNLLENLWFSSIFSDLSFSLPHLQKFLFPLISFRFTLTHLVANWVRRRSTTATRGGRWIPASTSLLTIYFLNFFRPLLLLYFSGLWVLVYYCSTQLAWWGKTFFSKIAFRLR